MKLTLNHKLLCLFIASLMTGLVYSDIANAADKQDKSGRRAALMMQKMKQDMDAEKTAMQAQFDQQKKELEDKVKEQDAQVLKLNKNLKTSQRKVAKLEGEVVKLAAEKTALASKLQQTQFSLEATEKNLDGLKLKYSQAQADLKFNDGQRKTLSSNLALTNKSLGTCEEKNVKLHQFGTELIKIYDKPSTYEAVMRKESFFQLKRVELENILQTYQDNLNSELLVKSKPAS